ncbi:M56 family metallopeptidase [Erythrobacter sp. HKB08]|uniref:M56 family metallopeptidase n=1 Tax=Erythrobacter sp. HKB08 TaxID=2502843 RepID=UPI001008D7E5|nr:M56 family metallopeptidase [Erythrobacter sp. HKB08]
MSMLLDTILWTGVLIALVLVLRRPVARRFGPQVAYMLWALPMARLVMPPITLPSWMAPQEPVSDAPAAVEPMAFAFDFNGEAAAPAAAAAAPAIDWLLVALAVWALGAAAFMVRRFQQYFEMRRELLSEARPMGEAGKIRLLETPATEAPIAFGVQDKVIALPIGFMALTDRATRDLALEHELAHHRGQDLLANFLVQPLFAMHWFNPLGWVGWRAMRRDQEAACDARVIAARGTEQKGAYASVIAGFATGPHVALAAPMACPVLGDKSIIHRLRSLTMSNHSPRRRNTGRALLAAGLIALPLTATISYAAAPVPAPPAAPAAPTTVPAPPAPPAPPLPLAVQVAPEVDQWEEADVDQQEEREVRVIRIEDKDEDGEKRTVRRERKVVIHGDEKMSREERQKMLAEVRKELAEMDIEIDEAMEEARVAMLEFDDGKHGLTKVSVTCRDGSKGAEFRDGDGKKVTRLCTSEIMASALEGLKTARAEIAKSKEMDSDIRAEVLSALDEKIAEMKSRN